MSLDDLRNRKTPLELNSDEFRAQGHRLVDRIADHFDKIRDIAVTPGESPAVVRRAVGADQSLPVAGRKSSALLDDVTETLLQHSLFNAHPRFLGYITAGPAPIGVLADLLASAVNPNVGAWKLAPSATEIEAQTIRWIYVPPELRARVGSADAEEHLNRLNADILSRMEVGGEAFLSNAVVEGKFVLRACIVNFRTSLEDIEAIPELIVRLGRQAHELRDGGRIRGGR